MLDLEYPKPVSQIIFVLTLTAKAVRQSYKYQDLFTKLNNKFFAGLLPVCGQTSPGQSLALFTVTPPALEPEHMETGI